MKAGLVFALAVLATGCGAPDDPPSQYERIASAATGGGIFGARILVDTFDGSCYDYDDTQGPAPWYARLGIQDAYNIATCGSVSFADGAVVVAAHPVEGAAPKTAWMLHATAVSSNEDGYSSSNVNALDTFTVLTTGTNQAEVYLRIEAQGTVAGSQAFGSPLAEYEVFTDFFRILPDGYFEPFFSPFGAPIFRREDGSFSETVELVLPAVDSGTELLMSSGFLFALAVSDGTGVQGAAATAEFSLCSHDPKVTILSASGLTGNCPTEVDVSIVGLEAVQSVFGASTMVAGKDTVIAISLSNNHSAPVEVAVRWSIEQAGVVASFVDMVLLPANCPKKRVYLPSPDPTFLDLCEVPSEPLGSLRPMSLEPVEGAAYRVSVEIDPLAFEDPVPTDNKRMSEYPVKRTQFSPAFIRIHCTKGGCSQVFYESINDEEFDEAVLWSDLETLAMYPVSPADFSPSVCKELNGSDCVVPGDDRQCDADGTCPGIAEDILSSIEVFNAANPFATTYAAYVPHFYFLYHGVGNALQTFFSIGLTRHVALTGESFSFIRSDVAGGTSPEFPEQHIAVVPHELVHSLVGFTDHAFVPADGFWIGCPVAPCAAGPTSLMKEGAEAEPPHDWIDAPTYELLLAELKVLPDPPLVTVSGTLHRDGTVVIRGVRELPEGRVSRSSGGEYSTVVLDGSGAVLSKVTGSGDFEHPYVGVEPLLPAKSLPFHVMLEYPLSAAAVEIRKGAQVLIRIDPLSASLHRMVELVPDRGFDATPTARRDALLAEVESIAQQIQAGDRVGAVLTLRGDFRDNAVQWVVPFDGPKHLETTEAQLLGAIASVVARLEFQIGSPVPTPTPTPVVTSTPTATATPSPTSTVTPTPSPTPTPTPIPILLTTRKLVIDRSTESQGSSVDWKADLGAGPFDPTGVPVSVRVESGGVVVYETALGPFEKKGNGFHYDSKGGSAPHLKAKIEHRPEGWSLDFDAKKLPALVVADPTKATVRLVIGTKSGSQIVTLSAHGKNGERLEFGDKK